MSESPRAPDKNHATEVGPPSEQLAPTLARPEGSEPLLSLSERREPEPRFGPPAHPNELGTFGRYRVLQKLGRGGMGAVYLGYDQTLDRKVALKVMLPQHAADPESRARFLREARLAARIKSDHVVTIFDVGEESGTPFIAMEYLLGFPLDQYLRTKGELPLLHALRVGHEVALGLAAAHDLGMIHRDIKPGNIWLEAPKGRVKILDFGLARAQNDDTNLTGTGLVVGTPAFMSPEQARGYKLDGRSDLFSLGVVLYRLCTGRLPFDGPTTMAILTSLAVDTPTAPRALNPELPDAVAAVVTALLAKNPAERYPTAQAAVDALLAAGRGATAAGPPVVAIPLTVGAQTQNVWDGIDDSASVAVPLAESGPTAAPRAGRARPSRLPLVAGAALGLAVVAVGAVLAWPKKRPDTPVEPTRPVAAERKPPKAAPEPDRKSEWDGDRKAADFILTKGGEVRVTIDGKEYIFKRAADLPAAPFELIGVALFSRQWTADDMERIRECKHLTRLMLHDTSVTEHGLKALRDLTRLEHLHLEITPMTDVGVGYFGRCKGLRVLSLRDTGVTDHGVIAFANCTQLTHLQLNGTNATDVGLARLVNNRELRGLAVSRTKITDATLERFAENPLVQNVEFAGTAVTDAGLAHLPRWRELTFVDASGTGVTDAGLAHLAGLPLVYTDLRATAVTDAGLVHLKGLATLGTLYLTGTKVTAAGVGELAKALPGCKIEWDGGVLEANRADRKAAEYALSVGGSVRVRDAAGERDVRTAADLPKGPFELSILNVSRETQVTDAGLAAVKGCKNLRALLVNQSVVSDAGFAHFAGCTSILWLEMYDTKLTDDGLAHFRECKNLARLAVDRTAVTDAGLRPFADGKSLAHLAVAGTAVTDAGVAHFTAPPLEYLDVRDTAVTDATLERLKGCATLTTLLARGTKVTAKGTSELATALPKCKIEWDGGVIEPAKK